jgi:hypothetical protein
MLLYALQSKPCFLERSFAMRANRLVPFGGLVVSSALLPIRDARACGGCFPPQMESQSTVVSGHRMAFAISTAQTVLWDQIKYAGSPKEFAWVLPIKGDAVLELSNDAWFETLDAATSAQVLSPSFSCIPASGPGCFCGGASGGETGGGDDLAQSAPPPVTVTHEGTVGPYETVTLHANVPNALPAWLTSHGYAIDPSVQPIIDAYTSEGFDFIALRLLPGQGVQQMKPVRVVTSGMSASLPLRMVAAGTGANVAITLFVIGEGRYEAQNFPNAQMDPATVTWDFTQKSSDYATVRGALLATNGGRTWNSAFAQQGSLLSQDTSNGTPLRIQVASSSYSTFAEAYVAQGFADGETNIDSCMSELTSIAQSTQRIAGDCLAPGTGGSGTGGGGTGGGTGTGGAGTGGGTPCGVPLDEIDARLLACGPLDDLAVALVGLHPANVWLTRLEANLPRAALATDLVVQASANQAPISSVFQTTNGTGDPCASAGGGTVAFGRHVGLRNRLAMMAAALGAVVAALARRRVRLVRGLKGVATAAVVAALLFGTAREARADEYQDHVGRAAALTQREQYKAALVELSAAYAIRQSPALLFEMARAQQRLGDAPAALDTYERFLAADVDGDPAKRAEAEAAVANLQRLTGKVAAAPVAEQKRERPAPIRYERKVSRGLMAGGAVLFGAGYLGAVVTGSIFLSAGINGCPGYTIGSNPPVYTCTSGNLQIASGLLLIPGAGPFLAAFAYRDPTWSLNWALVDGIAQAGGLTMMIYAAKHPREVPVQGEAFQLMPLAGRGVGGLQAVGRF